MSVLVAVGSVFVAIAALIHVLIFLMESAFWARPSTWRRFGIGSQSEADTVRPMAFNQGFYNLFLAVGAIAGLVMIGLDDLRQAGFALAIFAPACMVLAAVVLLASSPSLARAALLQGAAPLVGLTLLGVSLAG